MLNLRFWSTRPFVLIFGVAFICFMSLHHLLRIVSDWSLVAMRFCDRLIITCNIWSRWGVLTRPKYKTEEV